MVRLMCNKCGCMPIPLNPFYKIGSTLMDKVIQDSFRAGTHKGCGGQFYLEDGEAHPEIWWTDRDRKDFDDLTVRLQISLKASLRHHNQNPFW